MNPMETHYHRLLKLPSGSFFLFGPRGVGKSTWLREILPPNTLFIDLLHYPTLISLSRDPSRLEWMIDPKNPPKWICIDEVQKTPALLDEVHRLMEKYGYHFALSGSSARKLKRGGVNLLAGRALSRTMEALSFSELKQDFNLEKVLNWGGLPLVQKTLKEKNGDIGAADVLESYFSNYIREEIREEGLVRKIEPFLRFLEIAGLMNGQQLNINAVAQQAGVPRNTVETYFPILEDTLLGFRLPAYCPRAKVREQTHPKFYWFDSGVARAAAGHLHDPVDEFWQGKALETLLFQELRIFNQSSGKARPIGFYRTGMGQEIDFVIETEKATQKKAAEVILIELKRSKTWNSGWERPMRDLIHLNKLRIKSAYGLYTGTEKLFKKDMTILPLTDFLGLLHSGKIF